MDKQVLVKMCRNIYTYIYIYIYIYIYNAYIYIIDTEILVNNLF